MSVARTEAEAFGFASGYLMFIRYLIVLLGRAMTCARSFRLALVICVMALPAAAVTVTVDGTTYEISITAESGFPTNEVLLISQPWYNNKGLAQVFADAYVATGGSSTFNFVNNYLSFVYSSNKSTENFRTIEVADDQLGFGQLESFEGSDGFYQQNGSEFTFFFAYATAVSSIPEINSGALSQVLLILFALWLVVRRRETSTQAQ